MWSCNNRPNPFLGWMFYKVTNDLGLTLAFYVHFYNIFHFSVAREPSAINALTLLLGHQEEQEHPACKN